MKAVGFFRRMFIISGLSSMLLLAACDGGGEPAPTPNGNNRTYPLVAQSNADIFGQVIFAEYSDGSVNIILELNNTVSGNIHPAYLYLDNALEGNESVLTLEPVNGSTGGSQLRISALDDGTPLDFADLLSFDGHVKVHASESDLSSVLASGDIGANAFTGQVKTYELTGTKNEDIIGTIRFRERFNRETLVEIETSGLNGESSPGHFHVNSLAEGGDIAITLSPLSENKSSTNVSALDADAGSQSVSFDDLVSFAGHVIIHDTSGPEIRLASADIGINELTGRQVSYVLEERNASGVNGVLTFHERLSGETLARMVLENTTDGLMHPAHIHVGTAAQEDTGLKAVIMNPVNGASGISESHIARLDPGVGGTPISYEDLLAFDGYVNIHTTMADLTLLAQTDIGQNALTGESVSFPVDNIPGVTGTAIVNERVNGNALLVISLTGAPVTGGHPAFIRGGAVADGPGEIEITLSDVNSFGFSRTSVTMDDAGDPLNYADIIGYNGYIEIAESLANPGVVIAQGDFGSNGN